MLRFNLNKNLGSVKKNTYHKMSLKPKTGVFYSIFCYTVGTLSCWIDKMPVFQNFELISEFLGFQSMEILELCIYLLCCVVFFIDPNILFYISHQRTVLGWEFSEHIWSAWNLMFWSSRISESIAQEITGSFELGWENNSDDNSTTSLMYCEALELFLLK